MEGGLQQAGQDARWSQTRECNDMIVCRALTRTHHVLSRHRDRVLVI